MTLSFGVRRCFGVTAFIILVACGTTPTKAVPTTAPRITILLPSVTSPPVPATTFLPTNAFMATLEPDIPPGCMILNEEGKLYVLSEKEFFAFGPSERKLDEVLVNHYPDWASFEQNVSWYSEPVRVGKIVEGASFREHYNFNPAVTLVTLGESLDWQIPPDGDLYSRALVVSEALIRPALEWIQPDTEQVRAQYPQISSGATYALSLFFEGDEDRLQAWCNTYRQLFGESSVRR